MNAVREVPRERTSSSSRACLRRDCCVADLSETRWNALVMPAGNML